MKKTLFIFLIISIAISAQDFKPYQFKSGKVVYESTGAMTGTSTMIFDDYGMLEAKISNTVMDIMGIKQKHNNKEIMKGKWVYTIDLATNKGTKIENPLYAMFPNGVDAKEVGEEMMKKMGGKKIGTETINGKECDIWEIQQLMSKIWVWKSIPVKTEVNMMGMNITQIATSIDMDIEVSPDEFKIPENVEIKEMKDVDYDNLFGN